MSTQTINPNTNNNSFEKMTHREVDAVSQISNQQKKNPAYSQDKSNNTIEDIENVEVTATFQRRPQFRLSENNRRRFF